ncbi:MAG: hypothetical protein ACKO6K_06705 [Chitinophagaceae bacterium]
MSMLTSKKMSLRQLHLEHEMWANELSFYRDELRVLDKHLLEIVSKNTSQEVMKGVEHFQNQFIRQREVIDELLHDIKEHEQLVLKAVRDLNPIKAEKTRFEDHQDLRDFMETFKKIYADLKAEFLSFVSQWL